MFVIINATRTSYSHCAGAGICWNNCRKRFDDAISPFNLTFLFCFFPPELVRIVLPVDGDWPGTWDFRGADLSGSGEDVDELHDPAHLWLTTLSIRTEAQLVDLITALVADGTRRSFMSR